MFNLEQSIGDWRKQMLAAGIKSPVPLEELEIHLREEIERQMKSGTSARPAFETAVQKIGHARELKLEFKKVVLPIETRFVKLAGIACGVIAGYFSLWIFYCLLAFHEVNLTERMTGLMAVALAISSWRYGDRFLPRIPHRRVRSVIGILCCLASIGGMMLFIKFILPHLLEVPAGADLPVGRLLVSFVWALTATAMLGAVAYRLEDAARRNKGQYV